MTKLLALHIYNHQIFETVTKTTALACQNFMMALVAEGFDSCPMEGFDSLKLKDLLNLNKKSEINMIIGCGIRLKEGVYGDRFRIPFDEVYFQK